MVHLDIFREQDMGRGQVGGSGHAVAAGVGQPMGGMGQAIGAIGQAIGAIGQPVGAMMGQAAQCVVPAPIAGPSMAAHGMPGRGAAPAPAQGLLKAGEAFSFTISDGAVTAASVLLPSGVERDLSLAGGVDYALSGGDVLATQAFASGVAQVRYADADGDGLYAVVGTARVLAAAPHLNLFGVSGRETLAVTVDNGAVSGVTQLYPNGIESVLLSPTVVPTGVSWTLQAGLVVESRALADGSRAWEVFRDGNGDGRYTEVANGTGTLVELAGVIALTDPVAALL